MRISALSALAFFITSSAYASPLTFEFVNPAFRPSPESGDYLLRAAETTRKKATPTATQRNQTPTYQININNGSLTLQVGSGNNASTTVQSGSGNTATTTIR